MEQPLLKTETDIKKIFIFEDIFDKWLTDFGSKQLESLEFIYGNNAGHYSPNEKWFGCTLYDETIGFKKNHIPSFFHLILEIFQYKLLPAVLPESVFLGVVKGIVNGMLPCTPGGVHQDNEFNARSWSLVYFANDSDGDLVFKKNNEDNTEVFQATFKKGNLVMFPSSFYHVAMPPTSSWRITVGVTCIIETILNYE
jgi:hypothetical protein